MNKKELIDEISAKTNISKTKCKIFLDEFVDVIKMSLNRGERVTINQFGCWEVKVRKERKMYNPTKRKFVLIKAKNIPIFKISKEFAVRIL